MAKSKNKILKRAAWDALNPIQPNQRAGMAERAAAARAAINSKRFPGPSPVQIEPAPQPAPQPTPVGVPVQ